MLCGVACNVLRVGSGNLAGKGGKWEDTVPIEGSSTGEGLVRGR